MSEYTWWRINQKGKRHILNSGDRRFMCGRMFDSERSINDDSLFAPLCMSCNSAFEKRLRAYSGDSIAQEVHYMCEIIGGQSEMARRLGINPRTMRRWCNSMDPYTPCDEWMERMRDQVAVMMERRS